MRQRRTVFIERTTPEVFAFVDDHDSLPRWVPEVVSTEILHETEGGVGTRFRQVFREGGREMTYEGEITERVVGERIGLRFTVHGNAIAVLYLFAPARGGTEVTMECDVRPRTLLARLMAPLIWLVNRRNLAKTLGRLKAVLETPEPAPTAP